jgi:hypothetical protein
VSLKKVRAVLGTKFRVIGAAVAISAVFGLSACGSDDPVPPNPPTTTTTTAKAPPSDLTFSGVSVNQVVKAFEEAVDLDYDVKYVAVDGDAVECPGKSETVEGNEAQMLLCGDKTTLIVPESVGETFADAPPVGVWFFVAQQLGYSMKHADDYTASCVGGFVAQRGPDFTVEDMAELKAYLAKFEGGGNMYEAALSGIKFSQEGMSPWDCQPTEGGDRETP